MLMKFKTIYWVILCGLLCHKLFCFTLKWSKKRRRTNHQLTPPGLKSFTERKILVFWEASHYDTICGIHKYVGHSYVASNIQLRETVCWFSWRPSIHHYHFRTWLYWLYTSQNIARRHRVSSGIRSTLFCNGLHNQLHLDKVCERAELLLLLCFLHT